jgi:protein tyrosine phosphatase (PTP) superfamily phosphohydrolase (DUF442 family)
LTTRSLLVDDPPRRKPPPLDSTAERPGHPGKNGVLTKIVEDWILFIKSKGIHNVLIIMDDNEFGVYEVDLKEFYEKAGLTVYHIPFSSSDSYQQIMALIRELDAKGEKVVSHCTGGKGRCGRVACAWLCKKWNLSPLEASQEFIDQAVENGLYRLGDVQKLKDWMGYGSCEGTKSHDSSECCFPMDACS